ncbi:MAG: CpaD family pilus assembly lipoprotein [Hyphomicrobiales bacterium]|nr:CpaD family pilus assembly lipoprotein [Hyphomicrobiales bacterium]
MSDSTMKNSPVRAKRRAGASIRLGLYPVAAAIGLSLLSGCVGRDHVIVGAVPDDYRTNHPIVISEKNQVTDIPVGAADRTMTRSQREQLQGFLGSYDRSAAPTVQILLPQGSANEAAARRAAAGLTQVARNAGVPRRSITILSYRVNAPDSQPPIRVSYSKVVASAGPCGRWPDDLMKNADNKHYADFGCSYQRNLAAQVANPNDLIGPRKMGDTDAENRNNVINVYRGRGISPEFLGNSEVNY